jgi:hypothetical protein
MKGAGGNICYFDLLFSVPSEVVDFGSGQGRNDLETAGVAGLRRGFPKSENAGWDRKMPFLNGHYLDSSTIFRK